MYFFIFFKRSLKFHKPILLLLFLINFNFLWAQTEKIPIYTYHTHAPFIIAAEKGLSYDLAEYLNAYSNGIYFFEVIPMSRARVDKMLKQEETGIIPWVNSAWFNDINKTKYMWTDTVLIEDGNAVISNMKFKLEYDSPESFRGLVFGGIRGHQYVDIDDAVERGIIQRVDLGNHIDNFKKIIKDRIDFTIMPLTGAQFIIKSNNMENDLYISEELHSSYVRQIIIPDRNQTLKEFMERVSLKMISDPYWQNTLIKYK